MKLNQNYINILLIGCEILQKKVTKKSMEILTLEVVAM